MNNGKMQEDGRVISNRNLQGDYYELKISLPEIVSRVSGAGQFVDVQIPGLDGRLLRRPFSINNALDGVLTIVYKVVGEGTSKLCTLQAGTAVNVLGPCGKAYSAVPAGRLPVLVAGGYGSAALFMMVRRTLEQGGRRPVVLLGGRSAGDILLAEEFRAAGAEVRISTDDGSLGICGRVTALLEPLIASGDSLWISACGPRPMLKAVCGLLDGKQADGEISLDEHFCCGVGACFGCVVKVRDASPQGWRYARSCQEGPVFPYADIVW